MSAPVTISTTRLVLEPVGIERARSIVRGDLGGLLAAKGWPHADTVSALTMAANATRDEDTGWLIVRDREVIGDIGTFGGIHDLLLPGPDRSVEIGYGLAVPERGKGYATEAVAGLVEYLLSLPLAAEIQATTAPGNLPSIAVLQRNGFHEVPSPDPDRRAWSRTR